MPDDSPADRDGKPSAEYQAETPAVSPAHEASQKSLEHSIYADGLSAEERDLAVAIGTLDAEIALARIQLRRVLIAMKRSRENRQAERDAASRKETAAAARSTSPYMGRGGKKAEIAKGRPTYQALVDRWLGRIAQLERVRFQIGGARGPNAAEAARKINEVLAASKGSVHGPSEASLSEIDPSDSPLDTA